jgi:hypothetical protein
MRQRRAVTVENRPAPPALAVMELSSGCRVIGPSGHRRNPTEDTMGRYALLWLLGVPIPILLLIWAFGGMH